MPDVAFHTRLDDKLAYVCRLTRKVWRQGLRVRIAGDSLQLTRLDALLWTFEPGEFIPHARARASAMVEQRLKATTPIWLADAGSLDCPDCDVLINLGPEFDAACDRHARVIEVVGTDDADRDAGRQRWRQYEAKGWSISHHQADRP